MSIFMREPLAEWQKEARSIHMQQQQQQQQLKQRPRQQAAKGGGAGGSGRRGGSGQAEAGEDEAKASEVQSSMEESHIRTKVRFLIFPCFECPYPIKSNHVQL